MSDSLGDPRTLEDVERQFRDQDGVLKDKLSIDNSIAAHVRWRRQYKASCEGRLAMLNSCPTQEAVEYLRVEWKKYEMKCRDIEVGTTILMELDHSLVERIVAGLTNKQRNTQSYQAIWAESLPTSHESSTTINSNLTEERNRTRNQK